MFNLQSRMQGSYTRTAPVDLVRCVYVVSGFSRTAAVSLLIASAWQAFLVYAFGVRVVDDGHQEPSAPVDHAIDASRK
jgi:hypothetical protein